MSISELKNKWFAFVERMNEKGIPVPTIRDPKTKFGSISLTLVFISSVIVIAGIIGKSAGVLGGLDMNAAMEFFWTAVSLYWGRQFQTKSGAVFGKFFKDESTPDQESKVTRQPRRGQQADDPDQP